MRCLCFRGAPRCMQVIVRPARGRLLPEGAEKVGVEEEEGRGKRKIRVRRKERRGNDKRSGRVIT